eukprot:g30525.t1
MRSTRDVLKLIFKYCLIETSETHRKHHGLDFFHVGISVNETMTVNGKIDPMTGEMPGEGVCAMCLEYKTFFKINPDTNMCRMCELQTGNPRRYRLRPKYSLSLYPDPSRQAV